MHVVLSGASGLIGTALKDALRSDGHTLAVLVRRPPESPKNGSGILTPDVSASRSSPTPTR